MNNVTPPPKRTREQLNDERARIAAARCAKVLTLRKEGWRLKDIGREMGVSVERVRQMEMKGWRIDTFWRPENVAARERAAKEEAEKEAASLKRLKAWDAEEDARQVRIRRAGYDITDKAQRAIVREHAEQQLWRQFIEPRRPPVARPPSWLQWVDTAGVTYRDIPGRLVPEWWASV